MVSQLPEAIKPAITIGSINEPIPLYSGDLKFSGALECEIVGNGSVKWEWQPSCGVRFEADVSDVDSLFNTKGVVVSTKESMSAPVLITRSQGLGKGIVFGRIFGFKYGENESIDCIIFHVPNFLNYIGEKIEDITSHGRSRRAGRLVFEVDGWRIILDNLAETEEIIQKLAREGGYGITHVGKVCRLDGGSFNYNDVKDLLEAFSFFLSFSRGFWVNPVLHVGMRDCVRSNTQKKEPDKVCVVAKDLLLSPWHGVLSWFPTFMTDSIPDLFTRFWAKWCQPSSREVLRQVVWWYIEANGASITTEGRLVLAQVALEIMGYEVLTGPRGVEPGGEAADKISNTLKTFQIPIDIPYEMQELCSLAKDPAIKDKPSDINFSGPKMLTAIRNAIVHSKRSKRSKRRLIKGKHFTQAWLLSLWYLELVILGWLGYHGQYLCRLRAEHGSDLEPVPWDAPTPKRSS